MRIRKTIALAASTALLLGAAACTAERTEEPDDTDPGGAATADTDTDADGEDAEAAAGGLVRIAMPTRSLGRWNNECAPLEPLLRGMAYEASLRHVHYEAA